jgi:hypothetical protein
MFGRKAEASSTAYARVAGQLHHAALKTAKRWILDIPIHDIVEVCIAAGPAYNVCIVHSERSRL